MLGTCARGPINLHSLHGICAYLGLALIGGAFSFHYKGAGGEAQWVEARWGLGDGGAFYQCTLLSAEGACYKWGDYIEEVWEILGGGMCEVPRAAAGWSTLKTLCLSVLQRGGASC